MNYRALAILFITLFIVMVGFGVIFPILPFYTMTLGASPLVFGLLIASYSLMQFIFSPIWGVLSDRYGRKPILLIGLFGFSVTFLLFGLSNSLWMLFASRIGGGILSSACLPTALAYIADTTSEEDRGQGMGLMGAAMGLGMIVGPAIGGIFSAWHLGLPFFFSAGLAAVNFVFTAVFLKESKRHHSTSEIKYNRFRHLLSLRGYMAVVFFLVFLTSYSISGYEITVPLLAKARLDLNSYELGYVFAFMGIVGVIVQGLLIGRMIKSLGEARNIKVGLMIASLAYGMTFIVKDIFALIVFACLVVVGHGILRPSLASLISKDTELEEGATMGAMQSVDSFGRILGPVVAGFLFQIAPSSPYLSTGTFNLLAFLLFSLI